MKQVCVIHGGSTYDSDEEYLVTLHNAKIEYSRLLYRQRWNNWLGETLVDYDVLLPTMPNASNANYNEWALYFSKILPFLQPDAVLIGHSLGGIFLAKYLNEHADSLHFDRVILLAAPYDDTTSETPGSFSLPKDMSRLSKAADSFFLLHSRDDMVVPIGEVEKYHTILPDAELILFDDRQHFNTPTFPELFDIIKK
jgi:uncharacterized protein